MNTIQIFIEFYRVLFFPISVCTNSLNNRFNPLLVQVNYALFEMICVLFHVI